MRKREPTTAETELVFAGVTDIGRRRASNQDRFIAQALDTPSGRLVLLAVADGMGGAAGGEIASAHAVDELLRVVGEAVASDDAQILAQAIAAANRVIYSHARSDPELHGMGTTMVAALVRGQSLVVGHVGDSRAYLVRGTKIHRLTADHSWVAEQVRRGELTEEEAATSAFRNILTRSVGVNEQVEPDLSPPLTLEPGDILLLCSDGLHSVVNDATIARMVQAGEPSETAQRLVDLANERGGPDNITVVVARVAGASPPETGPPTAAPPAHAPEQREADGPTASAAPVAPSRPGRALPRTALALTLLVLAGAGIVAGIVLARRAGGGQTVQITASPTVLAASPVSTPASTPPMTVPTVSPVGALPLPTVPAVGTLPPCPDTGLPSTPFCQVRPELPTSPQEMAARYGISVECLLRVNAAQLVARLGGELPLLSPEVTYVVPAPEVCARLR